MLTQSEKHELFPTLSSFYSIMSIQIKIKAQAGFLFCSLAELLFCSSTLILLAGQYTKEAFSIVLRLYKTDKLMSSLPDII